MKGRLFLLVVFSLVLAAPVLAQDDIADWTYMQYFAMDNNLEGQIYSDMIEMTNVGSTDDVHIVAEVDRADGYDTRYGDWTDTRRFYLTHLDQPELTFEQKVIEVLTLIYTQPEIPEEQVRAEVTGLMESDPAQVESLLNNAGLSMDRPEQIERIVEARGLGLQFDIEPVETLGERDMGDTASLVDFVTWAIQNYPAEKYMLVISSHGGGWNGNGPDEGNNNDMLHPEELAAALDQIIAQTGIQNFEIVGFDACLMGQIEVYDALAPYTNYVLAAEEVIPGAGWEYTAPFTQLVNNPSMDGQEFGQIIIDSYMDYYAGPGARTQVDLHLIDTSQVADVTNALNNFASVVGGDNAALLSALGVARNNAQIFGGEVKDVLSGGATGAELYSSVDLIDFMRLFGGQPSLDPALAEAAEAVIAEAEEAIVYSRADDYLPGSTGIAFYFPLTEGATELPQQYLSDFVPYSEASPNTAAWSNFLTLLHQTIATSLSADNLSVTITDVLPSDDTASVYDPPVMLFDTAGEGIANIVFSATLLLDDGSSIMLDYSPLVFETVLPDGEVVREYPDGIVEDNYFSWNVEMPVVSDGMITIPTLIFSNSSGHTGVVQGVFESAAGEQVSASVIFSFDTRAALGTYGIDPESGAPFELAPVPGDKFTPYWFFFTPDGTLESSPADDFLTYGVEPFIFDYAPAESGTYALAVQIEDLAGNSQLSTYEVTVNNEGMDTSLRGFKDITLGFNFLIPWGWTDPSYLGSGAEDEIPTLLVTDPEGDINIFVDAREGDQTEALLSEIADLNASQVNGEVGQPEAFELPQGAGQMFEYTYDGDDGNPRMGLVMVVYVPENDMTYSFDLDTLADRVDEAGVILETMINSLVFFPPHDAA